MENSMMKKLDVRSLVRDVLRQWFVILILSLSVGMLTYVVSSLRYVPTYMTTTTFVVSDKANMTRNTENLEAASKTAENFKFVLEGQLLQKAVCEDLGLPSFAAKTAVNSVYGTNMIEMSVTAGTPETAFRIMRSIMENYSKVSDFVVGTVNINVLQDPMVPDGPSNAYNPFPAMIRNTLMALLLLCGLVGLLSFRRSTIKNVEQYKTSVDAYLLGAIYHERKTDKKTGFVRTLFQGLVELLPVNLKKEDKTISMLIDNPMRSFSYVEANRLVCNRVRARMDRNHAKVAMITSAFENEGKSTVSANLALALAKDGKKVLLMDIDLRRPSQYKIFRVPEAARVDLTELLGGSTLRGNPLTRYKDTSLYLLANSKSCSASDGQVSLRKLKVLIDYYRAKMDYILLDTSPMALVTDTEAMTSLADGAILVAREDVVPAGQINDTIDVLTGSGIQMIGCVFNDAHQMMFSDHLQNKSYRGYYGRE